MPQPYTFKDKGTTYALEVEAERTFDTEYKRVEDLGQGEVLRHFGQLLTYDQSLSALQARGFQRHLTPREFSQIFLKAINQGLPLESLDGVVKDILNPTRAITPELEAEFNQAKYHKKVENWGKHPTLDTMTRVTEPAEKMPEELRERWCKANDHDYLRRHPEFTAIMLTAFGEPSRIIAYTEPQNGVYDHTRHKYVCQGEKVEAKEIREFPLRMGNKLKMNRRGSFGLRLVQGFMGRLAPDDTRLPAFHMNATVELINKLCPELVDFLWGYDFKTIQAMVQNHEMGERFLKKNSFVMTLEQEGDLVPVLVGSLIDTTPLYVLAINRRRTANSRGARVLNQARF